MILCAGISIVIINKIVDYCFQGLAFSANILLSIAFFNQSLE